MIMMKELITNVIYFVRGGLNPTRRCCSCDKLFYWFFLSFFNWSRVESGISFLLGFLRWNKIGSGTNFFKSFNLKRCGKWNTFFLNFKKWTNMESGPYFLIKLNVIKWNNVEIEMKFNYKDQLVNLFRKKCCCLAKIH